MLLKINGWFRWKMKVLFYGFRPLFRWLCAVCFRGGSFQDDMFIVHLPTCGPQNHEKWRFYTPNIWVITLKMKVVGSHGKSQQKKIEAFHQLYSVHSWPQSSSLPQSLAQRRLEQAHQKSVAKEASGHWEKQKHQGCVHCSYVVVIQKEVWELGLFEFFFVARAKLWRTKLPGIVDTKIWWESSPTFKKTHYRCVDHFSDVWFVRN